MSELALSGGAPVRTAPFPTWPQYHPDDSKAVEAVLKTGRWGGNWSGKPGYVADELAQEFATFHDAEYGIPCTNGTIAIEVALAAAGIGFGDEVIVPALTFVATATAVLFVDALPVFADVDPDTLAGLPRATFVEAVKAEGIPLGQQSGQPVYRGPLFPWQDSRWKRMYGDRMDYSRTRTPVAEKAAERACYLPHEVLLGTEADMHDIIHAIKKVQRNADALRAWEEAARSERLVPA
jgi:dTDP-4-amino-4,6-dideoxygalactose transaminase